jgi:cellulose synthase operon protein YhjQ
LAAFRENEEMANDKKDDGKTETPEDVAALYGWANPENVKHRDFQTDGPEGRAQQQMQRPEVTRSEVTQMVKPPVPVAKHVIRRAQNSALLANRYRAEEHKSPENIYAVVGTPAAALKDDFAAQQLDRPAWLNQEASVRQAAVQQDPQPQPQTAAVNAETLTDTRERVASRWFALRGGFSAKPEEATQQEVETPVTAVFSLAGGVGKTSMVATLGRALSAAGERVLLADTTSYGLLPFYYGATELRPGTVRTFTPPPTAGNDSPVSMVSYDADAAAGENEQDWLVVEMANVGRTCNRVLVDIATASGAVARRILKTAPTVIIPIVPDMSSVIGLSAVEQFFRNHRDAGGHVVQPCYVLNQFDQSQPLHLDVREVLRQQLGDRLLPIVLRRSQAMSEALADGMTVIDYAPKSGIADDYAALANWLRNLQAPSQQAFRAVRWSEQG